MVMNRVFSLSRTDMIASLSSYRGVTTSAGSVAGDTLVCADLIGSNDFLTGKTIKLLSGPSNGETKPVLSFNTLNGAITLFSAVSAQIPANTVFAVLNVYPGGLDLANILTTIGSGSGTLQGGFYYGRVTGVPGANQFSIATLAGLGDGKFMDANNPYFAFVFRDAAGVAGAPQGEQQTITGYVSATGTFTTNAFTVPVAAGDEILIVHPYVSLNSLLASRGRMLYKLDLPWSTYTAQIAITAAGGNQALGAITVAGLPAGAVVQHLWALVKFNSRENTNVAVNSISAAQNIQVKKNAGAFTTGIALVGGEFSTPASTAGYPGDVIMPTADLAALAPANADTLTFQWTAAKAAQNNLNINDIQVGVSLWYSV